MYCNEFEICRADFQLIFFSYSCNGLAELSDNFFLYLYVCVSICININVIKDIRTRTMQP